MSVVDSEAAGNIQIHVDQNGDVGDKTVKSDGELSPTSLRRSTRACALKAQEKLKFKDLTVIDSGMVENGNFPERSVEHDEDLVSGAPKKKKPKLNNGNDLDQYDCKFGIRMDGNDVVLMSDESEISSLNAEEVSDLRNLYNDFKKHRVTDEQRRLREQQISELEAALRLEEAKLAMLKKIRQCQQQNIKVVKTEPVKPLASNIAQNTAGNAYKPTVATPPNKMNGTSKTNKSTKNAIANANMVQALANMTPQQQQQLLQTLSQNPMLTSQAQHITQILEAVKQQQQQAKQTAQTTATVKPEINSTSNAAAAKPTATATPETPRVNTSSTSQQRAAAARLALRREIDKQLLQIPQPKAPTVELSFIPNGAQPDFCYLLGLDLTVQKVLKDKTVFKRVEVPPYHCEECGIDFTPCWKAIGTSENDLHLYCEQCVKQAQKRKMKNDHTAVYKKVFQKISERERELEKQISAGKFDDPVPQAMPTTNTTPSSTKGASATTATPISGATAIPAMSMSGATATAHAKPTPSTSTQSQLKATPNVTPKQKRTPATSGNTANSTANAQSTTNVMAALQQQFATLNALRQSNPMLAMLAAQSNPLFQLQAQMWNPMLAAAAVAARPNMNANNNVNQAAMLALLAAAQNTQQQQQQQQQQQRSTSNTNTSNVSSTSNNTGSSNAAALAQQAQTNQGLLSMLAALNTANAGQGLNPQVVRQLQQLQQKMAKK